MVAAQGRADYARLLNGLPGGGPIAYWRCADGAALLDEQVGARHGSFTGTVSLSAGLPAQSDQALLFDGGARAVVPDDAGLHLAEGSLSGWIFLASLPSGKTAVVSKDGIGNQVGDFSITIDDGGELQAQFQDGTAQHAISTPVVAERAYHFCATWGAFGFDYFVDGKHIARNGAFTGGWTGNSQPLWFMNAQWAATPVAGVLDEVALYDYVLSDADVIALSQQSAAPVAGPRSATADESQTTIVDVAAASRYVGRKADLTVTITQAPAQGTATVNADNDIEFVAGGVNATFQYTLQDANGTSAPATVDVQVTAGGGTLVYRWQPLVAWIDGVALSSRNAGDVRNLSNWTDPAAATVGSLLPKAVVFSGGQDRYCFNRAPTGEPSIEINSRAGEDNPLNFYVQLYDELGAGAGPHPRHLRIVMEVKTAKSSDPSTHKANGLGTTAGSYPDWTDTHSLGGTETACKYFIGTYAGDQPRGGGNACWWNDHGLVIDQAGYRWQSGASSKKPKIYSYNFDRPNKNGGSQDDYEPPVAITDAGVDGVWHRIELEVRLCTPALAEAADARRSTVHVRPAGGDGYVKHYLTKDIDGELGAPGAREEIASATGLIHFPWRDDVGTDDAMHIKANLAGPWFCLIYGGSTPAQAEGWAWIRKLEVYRHD